jgi:hypothetical protein
MKYATITEIGTTEFRDDSNVSLPVGGVFLTEEDYVKLCNGSCVLVNGKVEIAPPVEPTVMPKMPTLVEQILASPADLTSLKQALGIA